MRMLPRFAIPAALFAVLFALPSFSLAMRPVQPAADVYGKALVSYENGRVSLKADRVPLLPLLEKIAAVADMRIVSSSKIRADELITADLSGWPLEKTLLSLLDGYNYMVIFGPGDENKGVQLLYGALNTGALQNPSLESTVVAADATGLLPAALPVADGGVKGSYRSTRSRQDSLGESRLDGFPDHAVTQGGAVLGIASRMFSASTVAAGEATGEADNSTGGQDDSAVSDQGYDPSSLGGEASDNTQDDSAQLSDKIAREEYLLFKIDVLNQRIESGYSDRHFEYWSKIKDPKFIQDDRALMKIYQAELASLYDS